MGVRRSWADYFDQHGVQYAFFSAANAAASQNATKRTETAQSDSSGGEEDEHEDSLSPKAASPNSEPELSSSSYSDDVAYVSAADDSPDAQDSKTKVLSVIELEALFEKIAPDRSGRHKLPTFYFALDSHKFLEFSDPSGKAASHHVVGLVGYPNVGKSSTINALLGEKKVSVSSTPGKTKHFQTIHLSDSIILCDCPGLVFPQFTTTKADLVCDGVLPIDQLREHTGPIALVVNRIPKLVLEATYGLTIKVKGGEEYDDGRITVEDFLIAYASEFLAFHLNIEHEIYSYNSWKGIYAFWTRKPGRGSLGTLYIEGLC